MNTNIWEVIADIGMEFHPALLQPDFKKILAQSPDPVLVSRYR